MILMLSCANNGAQDKTPALAKVWETKSVLDVPESVCYDPGEDILYVTNVAGKPTVFDSNGFVTKCGMDGKIIELQWVTGLNAPKGTGIYDGLLYVSDINRVVGIDLKTGDLAKIYSIPEATFLNDIAIDNNGNVYVSDMNDTRVYRIKDGVVETWLDDPVLTGPNGLFVMGDELLIGCEKIVKASLENGEMSVWLTGTGNIDGLEGVGDGRILYSDWKGNVYLVEKDKKILHMLDLTKEKKNAADIMYIPSKKLLFVPTFGANSVIEYKFEN